MWERVTLYPWHQRGESQKLGYETYDVTAWCHVGMGLHSQSTTHYCTITILHMLASYSRPMTHGALISSMAIHAGGRKRCVQGSVCVCVCAGRFLTCCSDDDVGYLCVLPELLLGSVAVRDGHSGVT